MSNENFISSSERAATRAAGATFVFLQASQVDFDRLRTWIFQNRKKLLDAINGEVPDRNQSFSAYQAWFSANDAPFPLAPQLEHARKSGLPQKMPIVELLLGLELSSGLLMGVHDLTKATLPLLLDGAQPGEHYESLMKRRAIHCKPAELVIRDQTGIIASVTQGPDFRTMVSAPEGGSHTFANIMWSVMGAPGVSATTIARSGESIENIFRGVSKSVSRVTLSL
jgi:hypothetical protein